MEERAWFYPQFQAASNAYNDIERHAVVKGLRPAAYQFVGKDQLIATSQWAFEHGLLCVPFTTGPVTNGYSSTSVTGNGNDFSYRVLLMKPGYYHAAFPKSNDELGDLLGYPECCREAFDRTWGQGQVDSTWEQTSEGKDASGPFGASTLLRWMGLRLVSHMPCTYQCERSNKIAMDHMALGQSLGYVEEMAFIKDVLNWPVLWSRLFGIAEIIMPALKISTRTDWTPTKDKFFRKGAYTRVTKKMWTDNGFASAEGMRSAHTDIINALTTTLSPKAHLMDLGCGNGHLMTRLNLHRTDVFTTGIDTNEDAIKSAKNSNFAVGRIQDGQWTHATAAIINPARLLEMDADDAARTREVLAKLPQMFYYNYDGLDVRELCIAAQLPVPDPLIKTQHVTMGVCRQQG